jgi:Tfp pilus assembly protein FimT
MIRSARPITARPALSTIEMTIVVLITGILASVGAPRYLKSLSHYQLDAATRLAAMDLRMARDHAIRTSAPQTVDFDATTESYVLPTMPDPDNPSAIYSVSLARRYSVEIESAAFGAEDFVQFDMYGKPTSSGTVVLQSGSMHRTIEIDAAGQVRIL